MTQISIAPEFNAKWPNMQLACIDCSVELVEMNKDLWTEIHQLSKLIRNDKRIEDISKIPAIQFSRKAYKACGKDPARYRLSAEALLRRVIKGNDLYQINNVVDIVNLASVSSGFSIGGYDIDQIVGTIELGIGKRDEPYKGIGRGALNIEGLPILRDEKGAFGSPTSDSLRTSVTQNTNHFLMVFFAFGAHNQIENVLDFAENLLLKYSNAVNLKKYIIK